MIKAGLPRLVPEVKMKRICLFVVVLFVCSIVYAHPPMKVHAEFDTEISKVFVEVSHTVKNTQKHYIELIKVYRNDELIITQEFDIQFDDNMQKAEYFIPGMVEGDEFKIFAECNMGGKDTETFTVENEEE